jgi:hypothetical protein
LEVFLPKSYAASNHNIPEAARRILNTLNYYDLELVMDSVEKHRPSHHFKTFRSGDAAISIASSAVGKPITVTISTMLRDGTNEELLFHYDPVKHILLSAMQTEEVL